MHMKIIRTIGDGSGWGVRIVLGLTLLLYFSSLLPAYSHNLWNDQTELKTYVVYDDVYITGYDYPYGRALIEYLGHFNVSIKEMPITKWTPGSMKDADLIVYIGLNQYDLPQELLAEMAKAERVIWFLNNIDQMAEYLAWEDFQSGLNTSGWLNVNVHYKIESGIHQDNSFNDELYVLVTSPGQETEELVTVSNANMTAPLAWKRDNIYFSGFLNFGEENFHILANLLHQFIPNDHTHSRLAFLRIEDVNPMTSPVALKAVLDVVRRHGIPFAIGVVPTNVAQGGASLVHLHEKPDLVKVLQEAQNNGGSIIMHGYSHQNIYSPTTGEGYEFWDARDDKPMEDDENFTRERLPKGIAELVRNGLIPLAFEAPHYAMSQTAYKVLSEYFNIFSGRLQLSDRSAKIGITLPYVVSSTYLNGMLIIPENLGYYDGGEFTVDGLLAKAVSLAKVQCGVAGLFYHGYLAPEPLDSILTQMKKQGYEFLDLRQFPIKVKVRSDQITIIGADGKITVDIDEQLKAFWEKSYLNLKPYVPYVIVFILVLAAGGIFAIIRFRRRRRAGYFLAKKMSKESE